MMKFLKFKSTLVIAAISFALIGFASCSDDEGEDTTGNLVTNIEIPQTTAETPVAEGESITIKARGFTEACEIWFRKASKNDVKAELESVSATSVRFLAPSLDGEWSLVLKQAGKEQLLGSMFFMTGEEPQPHQQDFQLAFASGSGSISGTYMQGVADVSTGTISFEKAGSLLSTGRTSRIFPSADGKYVYSLTYRQGTIDKWEYNGGSNYTKLATIDASVPLGDKGVRFYKLNEQLGSVHYIAAKPQYVKDGTTYTGHKMNVTIGILNFETMKLEPGFRSDIDLKLPGTLGAEGYYISRIDCPVLSNGKLYYGAAVSKFNASTGEAEETDRAMTFVIDYPGLENPTIIETNLAQGSTNGYRTPTQHVNEAGEIYQLISNGGNSGGVQVPAEDCKVTIVKIVNGQYDPNYKYSLDGLLKNPAASQGFFYVGNGIAYIPYEKKHLKQIQIGVNPSGEPSYSAPWGLARMDLINNTVVDLNTPEGLWLTQWQTSVVRNGKFHIALSPVGQAGHIYMFDVNSTSPDAELGAQIVAGADQYFIGIY